MSHDDRKDVCNRRLEVDSAAAVVADLRAEVTHADTKASMLIAAMSLGLAAPIGMTNLDGSGLSAVLARVGCLLWFLALGCLLNVLTPRYRRSSWTIGAGLSSFADVNRAARTGHLADALNRTKRAEQSDLVDTAADLSRIIVVKYRWIRAALVLFASGVTVAATSMMFAPA